MAARKAGVQFPGDFVSEGTARQQAIVRYLSINKQPERLPAGVLRETDRSH